MQNRYLRRWLGAYNSLQKVVIYFKTRPFIVVLLEAITRPKIAFSINKVYQYIHRLFDTHWKDVKIILRYLKGTSHLGA